MNVKQKLDKVKISFGLFFLLFVNFASYAIGARVEYTYTRCGNPVRTTWARGEWKEYGYDNYMRVSSVFYSSNNTANVDFSYDQFGNIIESISSSGIHHFNRYEQNRLNNEIVVTNNKTNEIFHTYDTYGRESSILVKINNLPKGSLNYEYQNDKVAKIFFTNAQECSIVVSYTNCLGKAYGYRAYLSTGALYAQSMVRDNYRRGLVLSVTNSFNGNIVGQGLLYQYDVLSRVIAKNNDVFSYNSRNEVVEANVFTNHYQYVYDNIGNRISSAKNGCEIQYISNALNQYHQVGSQVYEYDLDGNLISDGQLRFLYDCENRLVSAEPINLTNGVVRLINSYDYRWRRIAKRIEKWENESWKFLREHKFVYDDWNVVFETVSYEGGLEKEIQYFWGNDLSQSLHGRGGIGGLLAVSIDGTFYLPFYDAMGNILGYIDELGIIVAEYTYDPFGKIINQTGVLSNIFSYRFSTKYFDGETEFIYYGYRFYSPYLGRWINRDPMGEKGGLNLYCHSQNNLLSNIDVLGCSSETVTVEGAGTGVAAYQVTLNGKTAIRLSDELFYATGSLQSGMNVPRNASTTHFWIYKADNPSKEFRVDFHPLRDSGGQGVWHYNKSKTGFYKIKELRVANHSTQTSARVTGRTITLFKYNGKYLFWAAGFASLYDIYKADNRVKEVTKTIGGYAGAWAGAKIGAKGGMKMGSMMAIAVGNLGPQALVPEEVATVPAGIVIGGLVGSVGGGIVGYIIGEDVTEKVYEWQFTPLEKEEWEVRCEP